MTKLIDVAVLLQTHPRLNKAPSECLLVSRTFPGEGFFPVMSGRFGTADYALSVAAKPRLLLVGQDFGTVTYKLGLSPNIGEDWGGFPYLCHWLNEGGLAKDSCFFSNALLCLREGKEITGKSPGWRDKDYVLACIAAFVSIIDSLEPFGIVFFGAHVLKNFARKICPELREAWGRCESLKEVYCSGTEMIQRVSIGRQFVFCCACAHWAQRVFEKSWQLRGECVGCAPNFGDRNEDIRNGFDGRAMGVGGFDNSGRKTWGSSQKH